MNLLDGKTKTGSKAVHTGLMLDEAALHAALYRYCLSLTRSSWNADDLAQETWIKAIPALRKANHPNLEAFLIRVAKNTWVDQQRRISTLLRIQQVERVSGSEYEALLSSGLDCFSALELEQVFHALVRYLSPLQRTVFLLREAMGYTNAEAAQLLGTTEGAVKAALHRARQAMETVKRDLLANVLADPVDAQMRAWLRALVQAFQAGDMAALIELAGRGEVEQTMAIGIQLKSTVRAAAPTAYSADVYAWAA